MFAQMQRNQRPPEPLTWWTAVGEQSDLDFVVDAIAKGTLSLHILLFYHLFYILLYYMVSCTFWPLWFLFFNFFLLY
jgi:hypothetical protein